MQVWIPTNIEEAAKLKVESLKIKEASNKVSVLFDKEYFIQQQRHLLRWVYQKKKNMCLRMKNLIEPVLFNQLSKI